jgi:hypothetical protein
MASGGDDDYKVGRGKPPRHTRFKKGQSGNPNGRPRGSRNLGSLIKQELREPITVNENGHQKQLTKREAMVKRLVNSALAGDRKFLPYLVEYEEARETQEEAARARKPEKLTTVTDKEWALQVARILRDSGELDFLINKDDGAKPVETVPGGDSESTPE